MAPSREGNAFTPASHPWGRFRGGGAHRPSAGQPTVGVSSSSVPGEQLGAALSLGPDPVDIARRPVSAHQSRPPRITTTQEGLYYAPFGVEDDELCLVRIAEVLALECHEQVLGRVRTHLWWRASVVSAMVRKRQAHYKEGAKGRKGRACLGVLVAQKGRDVLRTGMP